MRAVKLHCIVIGSTVWRSSHRHLCASWWPSHHTARCAGPGARGLCATDVFLCPLLLRITSVIQRAVDKFARVRSNLK